MKEIIAAEVDISLGRSIKSYEDFLRLQGQVKNDIIDLRNRNRELNKELKAVNNDQTRDLETRRKLRRQLTEQIVANERSIKSLGQEARRLNGSFDKIDESNGAFKRLGARVRELKNEVKDLRAAGKPVPEGTIAELDRLKAKFEDINKSVGDFQFNVGNYQSAFSDLGDTIRNRLGEALTGQGGGVRAAVQGLGADLSGFAASGGFIAAAVVGVGLLAKVVADTVVEFRALRSEVSTTTNAINEEVDELTVGVSALANTFDVEFSSVLKSVNALTTEGLTDGFTDSIELARKAALALGPAFEEGNTQIAEYATQAAAAGLSGEELVEVLVRSTREGIFSDKGIDAIKEGGLSIREQTKTTVDAVTNAFGAEFSNNLFGGINDGSLSTIEGLKLLSTEIESFEGPTAQLQTVIADVFRGAGEDAGGRFLELINDLDGDIDSLIPTTDELTQRNIRLFEANEKLAGAQNRIAKSFGDTVGSIEVLGAELKGNLFEALATVLEGVDGLFDSFGELFGVFGDGSAIADILTGTLSNLAAGLKFSLDIAASVVSAFADLINTIADFVLSTETGAAAVDFLGSIFEALRDAIGQIPAFLNGVAAGVDQFLSNLGNLSFERSPFEAFDEAFDATASRIAVNADQTEKAVDDTSESIKKFGDVVDQVAKGSLEDLGNQISTLKDRIQGTPDIELQVQLTAQVEELEAQAAAIRNEVQRTIDDRKGLTQQVDTIGSLNTGGLDNNLDGLVSQLGQEFDIELLAEQEKADALAAVKDAQAQRDLERRAETFEQELQLEATQGQRELEFVSQQLSNISQLANTVEAVAAANDQSEISTIEARYARELELAEGNEEEIVRITAERDAEIEKVEREAFERQKRLQIAQALISGAQAVISTLAAVPGPLDIASLGLARVLNIAFTVATTGAQIAAISKQQFADGGILEGPSHANGGIQMYGQRGAYYGETEGGEPILKKTVSGNSNALGIASHVNMRMKGKSLGGSPLPPELAAKLDSFINGGKRTLFTAPQPRVMMNGGITQQQASAVAGGQIDYDKLEEVFTRAVQKMPAPVVGIKEFTDAADNFISIQENATV